MKPLLKSLIHLTLLLYPVFGFSQKFLIEGTIRDNDTRQPVNSASIILKNSGLGTTSNDLGKFRLEITGFPAVIFIQCIGYYRDTMMIENESQYIDTWKDRDREFLLRQNPIQINEVQIKARSVLFEKDPYAIIDFRISGNRILALGYKNGNEFRKEVLLCDLDGKMLNSHAFRNLDSIYQDCQGHVFAFCSDSAHELSLTRKQIAIQNSYPDTFIADFIAPVCGMTDSLIFLKKSGTNHQYENYFAIRDSQNVIFVYSTGGFSKEQQINGIRENWKMMAQIPNTAGNHDFPVPVDGRSLKWFLDGYDGLYRSMFRSHNQLLTNFRPVFTKMIPYRNELLIFDREAATIFRISEKGAVVRETGMNTAMNGIHYQDVHQDGGTGRIYVEYPQGPYTCFVEIDPDSGTEVRRFNIRDFRYIEKCEFRNNRLYFLYQPETGNRLKKVYSLAI